MYSIKAKIKDINGSQSNWGDLQLAIIKEKKVGSFLYQRVLQRFPILRLLFQMVGFDADTMDVYDSDFRVNSYSNFFPGH